MTKIKGWTVNKDMFNGKRGSTSLAKRWRSTGGGHKIDKWSKMQRRSSEH